MPAVDPSSIPAFSYFNLARSIYYLPTTTGYQPTLAMASLLLLLSELLHPEDALLVSNTDLLKAKPPNPPTPSTASAATFFHGVMRALPRKSMGIQEDNLDREDYLGEINIHLL